MSSRFVQFGADQDCHCGAVGCRRKLGVKPSKPKMCSEAALKLVACQVAVSSPKLEGVVSRNDVCTCHSLVIYSCSTLRILLVYEGLSLRFCEIVCGEFKIQGRGTYCRCPFEIWIYGPWQEKGGCLSSMDIDCLWPNDDNGRGNCENRWKMSKLNLKNKTAKGKHETVSEIGRT